jgi:Domain of unknown function (DUF1772)
MIVGELGLVVAALFAGAAIYVSFVEHPARQNLAPAAALTEWKPAYKRGAAMQASLAVIGFALGLVAWWQTGAWIWLLGAIVLVANWPWTLLVILPVNKQLLATDPGAASRETVEMLDRWARLHAMRTALGVVATLIFLWAALG